MEKQDKEFEELLKKAVCSYHEEEWKALPKKEELEENCQLSDEFYEKMDALIQHQKHSVRKRILRYAAVAACFLILTSGMVGMAAYVLMGAENFKEFFGKHARECELADRAIMDLEQLTDMAVTTTGTVYEDDDICLELKGLIKSGNMFSMILQGTLKQLETITVPDGPGEPHCYSFLESDVDFDDSMSASSMYYYQEDDENLEANQFLYFVTYSSENGFDEKSYTFTFQDFGYCRDDMWDEPTEQEDPYVVTCSGSWSFSVNMDQAKDISFGRDYHVAVNDGKSIVTVERIVLSPIGCSVYMTGSYSAEGSLDYFGNVKIKLKNGAYLDDTCYEMGMSESVISSDEEGSHEEVKKELSFEFRVPIDIRQVASVEVFGVECRIEPGEDTNP